MNKLFLKNASTLTSTLVLAISGLIIGAPQAYAQVSGNYLSRHWRG